MLRLAHPSLFQRLLLATALLSASLPGCMNNRTAVIPPPGGVMSQGDSYYNRPTASIPNPSPQSGAGTNVNLSPGSLPGLPPPPTTGSAAAIKPRDTYDVATRVPADSQPIRVLDSARSPGTLAATPRGMTLNDGTTARSWQPNTGLPATIAANPFNQLRGGSNSASARPQGFSGQEGQWRSRSSYEATERR